MDRGAWYATVHGVAKSRTRLSDFTYLLNGICSRDLFPHLVTRNLKTDVSTFWNSLMNNFKISWNNCKRYNFRCIWNMFIKNCYITFKNGRDLISTIIYSKYTCNFFFFFGCTTWSVGSWVEPGPSAVRTQSLNHWATREFLYKFFSKRLKLYIVFSLSSCFCTTLK